MGLTAQSGDVKRSSNFRWRGERRGRVDVDARNVIAALTVSMDPKFEFKIMTNLTSLRLTQFQGSGVDLYIIF